MVEPRPFRERFIAGDALVGTFVKTPAPHIVEVLGVCGFDFVVIDAEHAPFDRHSIDAALLAARSVGLAALVRMPEASVVHIQAALDDGASGILAPHISSVRDARHLAEACRYRGRRGYSNAPRAGGYGARSMWSHIDEADAAITVIAMVEDDAGVSSIHDILASEGVDGVFVGRSDLAVALSDRAEDAPRVKDATARVVAAARAVGKPVMLFAKDVAEAGWCRSQSATAIIVSSDQGLLSGAARHLVSTLASAIAHGK